MVHWQVRAFVGDQHPNKRKMHISAKVRNLNDEVIVFVPEVPVAKLVRCGHDVVDTNGCEEKALEARIMPTKITDLANKLYVCDYR